MVRRLSTLVFALVVVVAACGDDEATSTTTSTSSASATTAAPSSTEAMTTEAPTATEAPTTTEAPFIRVPIVELDLAPLPASTLWATFSDGTLVRIDGLTAEIEAELQVGSVTAMEVGLGSVWLASCEQQALIAVSAQLMEETGRWDLGGCPSDLAVADGEVLVALEDVGKVVSVHPLRDEVTTVIEIESPTAIDAGSPVLVGTADGKVGLWGRHDDGSLKHVWTTQFAGEIVAVNAAGFSHLFILVQSPDGSFFVAGIDALSGHIDASWDLNIFEVFDFFIHADWIFAAGGLPGRVWDTNPSGHRETTTDIPDSASGIAPNADQVGPPGAYVLGGDENGSSLYTTEAGSGEATEVGDLERVGGEVLAAQPTPAPCTVELDVKQVIAAMAAEGEGLLRGQGLSINKDAEMLAQVVARIDGPDLDILNPNAVEDWEAAGSKAGAVQDLADELNGMAFQLFWLAQKAAKECDPDKLGEMMADAEQRLQAIHDQVERMQGEVDNGWGHYWTAIGERGN